MVSSQVFDYTRNGLFYVPLFLLLGAAGIVFSRRTSVIGLLCSLAALIVEALLLHRSGIQRHDSMYFFFPFLMIFLFSLLLEANQGERRSLRQLTTVVYLIHPWCLVLVRGAAKIVGLTGLLGENTVVLFILVLVSSLLLSQMLLLLQPPRPVQTGRPGSNWIGPRCVTMSSSCDPYSRRAALLCQRSRPMPMGTERRWLRKN